MNGSKLVFAFIIFVLVTLCCLCLVLLVASGYVLYNNNFLDKIPTPVVNDFPLNPITNDTGSQMIEQNPASSGSIETLKTLQESYIPDNEPRDLAARLQGKNNIPEKLDTPPITYTIGDKKEFWVVNMDNNNNYQITSTLQYASDHAYFWIEDGVRFDTSELRKLGETFENNIYPTNREFFGSEWSPGVDNDNHLYILLAKGMGGNIAGYFSSVDELLPQAHEFSNTHETIMMNADNIGLSDPFTYGVLAHEFQHMIHWYQDRNEATWLNEGFSELAAFINGFYESGFDNLYILSPDLQLNDWPNDPNATTPHYGAAFLFVTYFLERFGEQSTQALVSEKGNGMESIDKVLMELGKKDPLSGDTISADDVFSDWVITNFLNDASVGDGRYAYRRYFLPQQTQPGKTISKCPYTSSVEDVKQFGVDYIKINCKGNFNLSFTGQTEVGVLPINASSGNYAFWSNRGDESDMTLTREFDFSSVNAPITLTYWVWYDLEKDYDFAYVEASEDGKAWQILRTPSGADNNISGNSYGWAYNNKSIEWIKESVDLSQFAGKKIQIRFEYVTDAAVNGEGLLIDDIAIPEIGYQTNFESDSGGWEPAGFVRIENRLPQTYALSLIKMGKETTIEKLQLNNQQKVNTPITIGENVDNLILVVSGTTRFTRQLAKYQFSIAP